MFSIFFKQKTAYEIPKRDWSSDVCSSDLDHAAASVRLFLERAANAVRAVRAMYAAGDVTDEQFQRFAQTLSIGQDVSAIGFVRRVEEANRAAYEATLTTPPGSMVGIWEADAKGNIVRAAARPIHLVLEATQT